MTDITTQDILKKQQELKNENILAALNRGLAGNIPTFGDIGKALGNTALNIGEGINKFVKHGYKPGNLDEEGVENSFKVAKDLFGLGVFGNVSGLGATGGAARGAYQTWTPTMQESLKRISQQYAGSPKVITSEFRSLHPNYQGTDATIMSQVYKIKNLGGVNIQGGATPAQKIEANPTRKVTESYGPWDERMFNTLKFLDSRFGGVHGGGKKVIHEFRGRHPEFQGSDATIRSYMYRMRGGWRPGSSEGGGSTAGIFGGRIITPTPQKSPEELVKYLENNAPVNRQWVENWLERAEVPYKTSVKGKGKVGDRTAYIEPQPVNPPLQPSHRPVVRVPKDSHIGHPPQSAQVGNFVDTGTLPILHPTMDTPRTMTPNKRFWSRPGEQGGHLTPRSTPNPHSLTNQSNMSYANPEAMDAFLKYRLSTAPDKGNWLIPPDMAPIPKNKFQSPMPSPKTPIDPRQIEMNFGPEDILRALQGRY